MRVNLEWLRDWVQLDADVARIADALTTAGLEVDAIEPAGPALDGIVVGQVLDVARHPNADRLSVCRRRRRRCAAPGGLRRAERRGRHQGAIRAGRRTPARRQGNRRGRAARRAVPRNAVLGQGARARRRSAGLMLLDADAPPGMPLKDYLRLDDAIFEVNVTANRGDCFSVLGIARELAAGSMRRSRGGRLGHLPPTAKDTFPVELQAGALCPRFAGRVVRGLRTGGEIAVVDARAPAARRLARDSSGCRRDELRDARARPAAACLRPEQARGPHRRASRARRRVARAARRQDSGAQRRRARHRGRCETRRRSPA